MRVIAGQYKGMIIPMPKGGTIRPTTDRAKEALFSILNSRLPFEDISVCDLFCGSGNISFEFASRGAKQVTSVEKNKRVLMQAKDFARAKGVSEIKFIPTDVFAFIKRSSESYDVVFADPPYNLRNIVEIPSLIQQHQLLKPDGLLIIEHESTLRWESKYLIESRNYGQSVFSMFQFPLSLDE